ncbi:hypothetical protein SOVF_020090 [Spinacia oleracea]|nr:hypothetical protein SOVF_020090 [Spinacia oleracea]
MQNSIVCPPEVTIKPPPWDTWCADPRVSGTPLFELVSLRKSKHTFQDPHLEIFGSIILIDEHGNEFLLFRRMRNEAKTVFIHNSTDDDDDDDDDTTSVLLHNFDIKGPRCLPSKFCLKFNIKDKLRDIAIIQDSMFIDCTRRIMYDKLQSCCLDTPFLSVLVDYAVYGCALIASVAIVVDRKRDEIDNTVLSAGVSVSVSGILSATALTSDMAMIKHVLFDGSQKLVLGALNTLSTFSVPSYSLLECQVNLDVEGEKFIATLKFLPDAWFNIPFEQEICGETSRIRVIVYWTRAQRVLPDYPVSEYLDDSIGMSENTPRRRHLNKGEDIYIQPYLRDLGNQEWFVSDYPIACMEIFSIVICPFGNDGGLSRLRGEIKASDNMDASDNMKTNIVIFDSSWGCDTFDRHETLKLTKVGCLMISTVLICFTIGVFVRLSQENMGMQLSITYFLATRYKPNWGLI